MSVSGLCQVCETEPAVERCKHCGALVCSEHYDREYGACLDCASSFRNRGPGNASG